MNIEEENSIKIYEYFNDIGIIDYDNVNLFLNIYSDYLKKSLIKNKDDILKIALFTYMKIISQDEKKLYEYANRVINSFKNNRIISKYKAIKIIKTILYLNLRNVLSKFIFELIKKKQDIKFQNKTFIPSQSTKIINSKNIKSSFKNLNCNSSKNITIDGEEKECTFSPRINKNFHPYNIPIFDTSENQKKSFSNLINKNKKSKQELIINTLNNGNISSQNLLTSSIYYNKNKTLNKKYNTLDNKSNNSKIQEYDFYKNEIEHLERVNKKILNMKIKKNIDFEKDCTFKPNINKKYSHIRTLSNSKSKNNNNTNLNEEKSLHNKGKSDPNYYKKLFNDAQYYKQKELENEKKEIQRYSFSPNIIKNKKYIVTMNFNERRTKSIENKINKQKKKDEEEKKIILENIKKKLIHKNKTVNNKEIISRLHEKEYEKKKNIKNDNNKNKLSNYENIEHSFITFGNLKSKSKYYNDENYITIEEPLITNSDENDSNIIIQNKFTIGNENTRTESKSNEKELFIEKIKNDHLVNFKNSPNKNIENNILNKFGKNYIEIQSLSSDTNSFGNCSLSKHIDNHINN